MFQYAAGNNGGNKLKTSAVEKRGERVFYCVQISFCEEWSEEKNGLRNDDDDDNWAESCYLLILISLHLTA